MANFSFTGNDGTQVPRMRIGFSNRPMTVDIRLQPTYTSPNSTNFCIFEGTVRNDKSLSVTVIGCLYENPKDHPQGDNHRFIYLRAKTDSGGYFQYYISNSTRKIETVKFKKYKSMFYI